MTRFLFAVVAGILLWPLQAEARIDCGPATAPAGALTRVDNKFAIAGTPRFLLLFSYFGAKHQPLASVQATFREARCAGFNGVRIFADFWSSPGGSCGSGAEGWDVEPLIYPNGSISLVRQTHLANILATAKAEGLVVDLSFAYETVQGRTSTTFAAYLGAMQAIGAGMGTSSAFEHVMVDVQNEYDNGAANHPCYPQPNVFTQANINALVQAFKGPNPSRVVFASGGMNVGTLATMQGASAGALAVHEFRAYFNTGNGYNWYDPAAAATAVPALHSLGASGRFPLYMQEPDRWMGGCSTGPCTLTGAILRKNAADSKRYGAAAWTFHTEHLFWPHLVPNPRPAGGPEIDAFYGVAADLAATCWGLWSPSGWFASVSCP